MSTNKVQLIKEIYNRFNARDIDGVLAVLVDDVVWANGMDGGYVIGHGALREYWTRQWAVVSPHVEPVTFQQSEDGAINVEVIQSVFDLDGKPLNDQPSSEKPHGLKDKTVVHIFWMDGDKIKRFDIRDEL